MISSAVRGWMANALLRVLISASVGDRTSNQNTGLAPYRFGLGVCAVWDDGVEDRAVEPARFEFPLLGCLPKDGRPFSLLKMLDGGFMELDTLRSGSFP